MSSYLLEEIEERKAQLEKIHPIRMKYLKFLHTCRRERIDHRTVKIITQ